MCELSSSNVRAILIKCVYLLETPCNPYTYLPFAYAYRAPAKKHSVPNVRKKACRVLYNFMCFCLHYANTRESTKKHNMPSIIHPQAKLSPAL